MTGPAAPDPSEAPAPRGGPRRRTVVVAGSVVAAAAVAGGAVLLLRERPDDAADARAAADAVAAAWTGGAWAEAPLTGAPADPAAEYARLAGGLASAPPRVRVVSVDAERAGDGTASAQLEVTFDLAAQHGAPAGSVLTYATTAALRRTGEGEDAAWRAVWSPALVHPALAQGATFVLERTQPPRADVLGRDGLPVVTETDVVDVGVQPSRTKDAGATATALAGLLGVDGAGLAGRIQQASPDAFVDVVTLRRTDYDAQRDALQAVPGAVFRTSTLPLAPTRAFARALLGGVGQVTAEVVEASGGRYAAGDLAGLSGLQARYDERLAGRVGVVVRASGGTTALSQELVSVAPVPGETVRTSLDNAVQQAADEALASVASPSALVAVDTATGEVLAVANGPATGGDRALTGRFPPGSTFKVATTLALLGGGFDPASNVACTPTYTVDGRSFRNFEGEAFGDVPFRQDFAQSCNTAFASLSPRLGDDALRTAAAQLGVGEEWSTGVDAFAGDVPATESDVDRAAASFGQGRTLVSPLAMAVAAASVAAGALRRPVVVLEPAPAAAPAPVAAAARPEDLATLAGLMRDVVTDGTATVLADVPGAPVQAKTGTAEYGSADPLPTHAWTIGWQGSTAFAVFVTDGTSGGAVAAPIARDFLTRTAAGSA
ncbi:penicillin-binding transpeptidase domain-containing protein [Kineococcus rubinsiae]|uniref:penicillin-binding transpeptidase domain-containing protein n=1 Tax=Kineococcus rubinsiae TaxID=2609562 RepID=UPI0014318204|nr:penicillin-binding transpeptidase domain-containing protein [Kineococcus rubinsiae]NIZ91594.1 penicillin-binding protein [Kineococcus rubinsiae]